VIIKSQEVIGFILGILFSFESLLELVVVDEFTAIFDHKITHFDISSGFETPAFTTGIEWVERWGSPLLEPLIGALWAAMVRTAFNQQHPNFKKIYYYLTKLYSKIKVYLLMQCETGPQGTSAFSSQSQGEAASGDSRDLTLPIGLLDRILLYGGGF